MARNKNGRGGCVVCAYGSDNRLVAGNRDNGGLSAVNRNIAQHGNVNISFRVLAVHDISFIQPPSIFPISWRFP